MSLPAILIRKSTGEILKRDNYPRTDMQPVEGLDPDLEYLLVYEPYIEPSYDSRIFVLSITEEVTAIAHPDYTHLNQFKVTYSTEKRLDEAIKLEVDNAESLCNEDLFLKPKQLKYMVMAIGALNRARNGITLTAREIEILDTVQGHAVKFSQAESNADAKYIQIDNNEEPDIDAGWPV